MPNYQILSKIIFYCIKKVVLTLPRCAIWLRTWDKTNSEFAKKNSRKLLLGCWHRAIRDQIARHTYITRIMAPGPRYIHWWWFPESQWFSFWAIISNISLIFYTYRSSRSHIITGSHLYVCRTKPRRGGWHERAGKQLLPLNYGWQMDNRLFVCYTPLPLLPPARWPTVIRRRHNCVHIAFRPAVIFGLSDAAPLDLFGLYPNYQMPPLFLLYSTWVFGSRKSSALFILCSTAESFTYSYINARFNKNLIRYKCFILFVLVFFFFFFLRVVFLLFDKKLM